jgi:subtilisin-like proprotein convertase family protein
MNKIRKTEKSSVKATSKHGTRVWKEFLLMLLTAGSLTAQAQLLAGSGFSIMDATASGTGYSSDTIVVAGTGRTVGTVNRVTLTGLSHTWIGDLQITLYRADLNIHVDLVSAPDLAWSNFNGTYTFLVNPSLRTVDEAILGQPDRYDLPSGSHAMSTYGGGTANGTRTNFSAFAGVPLDGIWMLEVWDYATGDTGSIGGWSLAITPAGTPGDVNGNGCVDDTDLLAVLFVFGTTGFGMFEDSNQDGTIDDADLLTVLLNFGTGC